MLLYCFPFNTMYISSSLWAIPLTFQVAYLIIFCFYHFRLTLLAIVRRHVCRSVVFTLTVQSNNSLDRVTSLPLGSPVVGLLPFSPCTCVFCSISSADDEQFYRCAAVSRASLVGAGCTTGRWRWRLGRRGYWLHFITPNKRLKPLTLFQTGKGILTYVKFERTWLKPLLRSTKRNITWILMTDVPTYGKKNLADSVAINGRGREIFRPPTYHAP